MSSYASVPLPIRFSTLGSIDLRDGAGHEIPEILAQPKRLALLAYIATADSTHYRRDTLVGLFWPELSRDRARTALNKAVYFLRRYMGRDVIVGHGAEELGLATSRIWCDVQQFERAFHEGRYEDAVGLYRGQFLDGLFLSGAPEFELWLVTARERLSRHHATALGALAVAAEARGNLSQSAQWWRRMVERDACDTKAVVGLMSVLEALGERGSAIHEAERHTARLKEELDAEPDPEVTALAERLRHAPRRIAVKTPSVDVGPVIGVGVEAPTTSGMVEHARDRSRRSMRARVALAVAVLGVFILAGFLLAGRGVGPELRPGEAAASRIESTIAVLPFDIEDPTLNLYREGILELISTGLDGTGGLRTVDSRAVLSRWGKARADTEPPDRATSLGIARGTGATYLVVGKAVRSGPRIRLNATVLDVETGSSLGESESEGSPDSLEAVVEGLATGLVRVILGAGGADSLSYGRLSAAVTSSLPALRAYLEGEGLYRRSDFAGAIEAYERAVQADSGFALAYYRLGMAHGWAGEDTPPRFADLAAQHVEGLPFRDASLIRAYRLWLRGPTHEGLDLAAEIVQKWPEDAEGWHLLGEYYRHLGGSLMAPPGADEQAFARAVALDPAFAPYHFHHIERAFFDTDSAEAARRLAAYSRIAQGEVFDQAFRLAFALAFGGERPRSQALAKIDTLPTEVVRRASQLLAHPRFLALRESLLRETLSRRDVPARELRDDMNSLGGTLLLQGRFRELSDLEVEVPTFPHFRSWLLTRTRAYLNPDERPSWAGAPIELVMDDTTGWIHAGSYAVDTGQWEEAAEVIRLLRSAARRKETAGESVDAARFEAMARALEGYRLWKTGRPQEALTLLGRAQREVVGFGRPNSWNGLLRWWLGKLLFDLERPKEAAQYFESLWYEGMNVFVAYELARTREALGDRKGAIVAYRNALEGWHDVDPKLLPRVEKAARALNRLEASEGRIQD